MAYRNPKTGLGGRKSLPLKPIALQGASHEIVSPTALWWDTKCGQHISFIPPPNHWEWDPKVLSFHLLVQGTTNPAFSKPCKQIAWVTPAIFVIRRSWGSEERSPFSVGRMQIRHFRRFRQNRPFVAGDKITLCQKDSLCHPGLLLGGYLLSFEIACGLFKAHCGGLALVAVSML